MRGLHISVRRVADQVTRRDALAVLRATYQQEKSWVENAAEQIPLTDLQRSDISWFAAYVQDQAAGVLRVCYDPPIGQQATYQIKLLDKSLDVKAFFRQNRVAEIGRFAVVPRFRRHMITAVALIRVAVEETIRRGYTHYITDVFEDDPHSPYQFHVRVMGFKPVATHETGELCCHSRRITLILDLQAAYQRLQARNNWIFRFLTADWDKLLHQRLQA
jgi:GNAT superfamily N-acetyltransferase